MLWFLVPPVAMYSRRCTSEIFYATVFSASFCMNAVQLAREMANSNANTCSSRKWRAHNRILGALRIRIAIQAWANGHRMKLETKTHSSNPPVKESRHGFFFVFIFVILWNWKLACFRVHSCANVFLFSISFDFAFDYSWRTDLHTHKFTVQCNWPTLWKSQTIRNRTELAATLVFHISSTFISERTQFILILFCKGATHRVERVKKRFNHSMELAIGLFCFIFCQRMPKHSLIAFV